MRRFSLILIISSALIFLCSGAGARDMQRYSETIEADTQVKKIHLKLDIDIANLKIVAHSGEDMLTANARYDADKIRVDVEYEGSGSEADIFVISDQRKKRFNLDSDDCRWQISLSTDYTWDIIIDAGVTEGRLNLSGLPIERLKMDIGAGEFRVIFEEPNPESMRKFTVDAGAGELKILGIGYANCEVFNLDGGAGEFVLNFEGMTDGFHSANIDIGVGEVVVELPEELPVRLNAEEGWLNSINVRTSELDMDVDGRFETGNYDDADYGLEIDLDVGIGEASIVIAD